MIDRLKKCFAAPNGWNALKWCPISLPFANSFIILLYVFMSFHLSSFIQRFHFKSCLLHFISPFSLFFIPRLYPPCDLKNQSPALHIGKSVELGVPFVFTIHVWMIWHSEIRNPPNMILEMVSVQRANQGSLMWFLNYNTMSLYNTSLEKNINSKGSVKGKCLESG